MKTLKPEGRDSELCLQRFLGGFSARSEKGVRASCGATTITVSLGECLSVTKGRGASRIIKPPLFFAPGKTNAQAKPEHFYQRDQSMIAP
ncbi:MAG: hypothetical protein RR547_00895 [Raoultibacter sp.]